MPAISPRSGPTLAALAIALALGLVAAGFAAHRWLGDRAFRRELERAREDLTAGRHASALRRLREQAGARPDSGELNYLIGLAESARGRPDRAGDAFARIDPADFPHAGWAALQWAEDDRARGRLAPAEARLRAALEGPGEHRPRVRWALAQLLLLEGRGDEARRVFADGLPEHPEPVEALKVLYKLEADPFPLDAARGYFGQAAQLAPDDDRVRLGRANLALQAGDFPTAEALLRACLDARPGDPPALRMLLDLGREAGRPDLVTEALEGLPAETIDDREAAELVAWAARLRGDREAERAALARRVELGPPSPPILERLAALAIEAGRPDEAAELRARKADFDRDLRAYLLRIGTPEADADPLDMARRARALGRDPDAAFWRSRAGEAPAVVEDAPGGSTATVAQARPDLRAAVAAAANRPTASTPPSAHRVAFADEAEAAGLRFTHRSGSAPGRLIPTVTASGGVAILDYDRDGFLDVFAVQSGPFPPGSGSPHGGDRLFRNRGDGTFEDATARAGLGGDRGYGHGVAVGDVNGDGHADLFVTRWRSYALYVNRCDGTFADATASWGLGGDRDWPTSAAFADLDGDGDLDLYVCHYLRWDEHDDRTCADPNDPSRYVCNPLNFPALPDHLFRNDGGRFVDVTAEAGIDDRDGRGLGVVAADVDGDGRVDLFVANDMTADRLHLNRGGLRFEEVGHEAGVAANAGGGYQAGMGTACADLDGDGRFDLAVTNFYGESTSAFRNLGGGLFADATAPSGLQAATRSRLGFGLAAIDADNDGRPDLLTANGHVHDGRPVYPWAMPLQLLRNRGDGTFADATGSAGPPFQVPHIARGLASGDLDADGRIDAVVQCQDEPLVYLHNRSEAGHFLVLELEGTASNRDAVGAVVTVVTPDGRSQVHQRVGGGSFQSAPGPRIHAGLGDADRADRVEVRWPSGRVDRFDGLPAGAGLRLIEGDPSPHPLAGYGPTPARAETPQPQPATEALP